MRIKDILKQRDSGVSFEFFPPKTDAGMETLRTVAKELARFDPLYVSVTYGAGGSTQDRTRQSVRMIRQETGLQIMPHLTCIGATRDSIDELLREYIADGFENILALRGDYPQGVDPDKACHDFNRAEDLVRFIGSYDHFSIGVALCPEGHPESPSLRDDVKMAARKIRAGADFGITQMFFDNEYLYRYADMLKGEGVDVPVIPGIIPVTDIDKIRKFAELNKTTIPAGLQERMEPLRDKPEEMYKVGIEFAIKQCRDLMANGYRYMHFFALNRSEAVSEIVDALNM